MIYLYGMRLRGFSIGCQPMKGFLEVMPNDDSKYHNILMYNRKLSDQEINDYELDYPGKAKE